MISVKTCLTCMLGVAFESFFVVMNLQGACTSTTEEERDQQKETKKSGGKRKNTESCRREFCSLRQKKESPLKTLGQTNNG